MYFPLTDSRPLSLLTLVPLTTFNFHKRCMGINNRILIDITDSIKNSTITRLMRYLTESQLVNLVGGAPYLQWSGGIGVLVGLKALL